MMQDEKKYLTVQEVADMLRVEAVTIRRYLKSGKLIGAKLGGVWVIEDADLKEFVESRKNKKVTAATQ